MAERDFYEEAHQLASQLVEEGFGGWAKKLEAAITEGFTASEILMGLRWHARQLRSSGLHLSDETNSLLQSFISGLDDLLG